MCRKLLPNEVQERIDAMYGKNFLTLDVSTYVNVRTKCKFCDCIYGDWWVKPDNVLGGQSHPKRWELSRVKSVEKLCQQLKEKFGDQIVVDTLTYVNCSKNCKFIDVDYGIWYASPRHVLSGHGHPKRGIVLRSLKHVPDVEIVAERVTNLQQHIMLDKTTYINMHCLACFIDETYGKWWTTPSSVLMGHGHPVRGRVSALKKGANSLRMKPCVLHWKTGVECFSQSGWEYAVLLWLNQKQYDFDWQIPFLTPFSNSRIRRKSIYIVDLYIKDGPFADTWVEIKGRWHYSNSTKVNNSSKNKWDWFHAEHINSQLWMKDQLIELGIIDKNGKSTYR